VPVRNRFPLVCPRVSADTISAGDFSRHTRGYPYVRYVRRRSHARAVHPHRGCAYCRGCVLGVWQRYGPTTQSALNARRTCITRYGRVRAYRAIEVFVRVYTLCAHVESLFLFFVFNRTSTLFRCRIDPRVVRLFRMDYCARAATVRLKRDGRI